MTALAPVVSHMEESHRIMGYHLTSISKAKFQEGVRDQHNEWRKKYGDVPPVHFDDRVLKNSVSSSFS